MAAQGLRYWVLNSHMVLFLLLPVLLTEAQPAQDNANYYDILNVSRSATSRQIKKAFHTQAMKYHPDKNKSAGAEKLFRAAAEAYEVLSNTEKRKRYDRLGHDAFKEQESTPTPEPDFSFPFDQFFSDFVFVDAPFEENNHWTFHSMPPGDDDWFEDFSFSDQGGFYEYEDDEDVFFY